MLKKIFYTLVIFASSVTNVHASHIGGSLTVGHSPFGVIGAPFTAGSAYGRPGGLGEFISNLVSAATIVAGLGFLAYLIYGAFRFLTAAGDDKAIGEAKKSIAFALIGLGITVLALSVTAVVQAVLGINILRPQFRGP